MSQGRQSLVGHMPTALRKLRGAALRLLARVENNGDGVFERNGEARFLERLLRQLGPDAPVTVIDVGSNVGHYASAVRERAAAAKVEVALHLFEPTAAAFDELARRFAGAPGVTLNRAALSDTEGTAEIFFDTESSTLASLYPRDLTEYRLSLGRSERVPTLRLDCYLAEGSIPHVHFLKLDVEGHELAVLRGLGGDLTPERIDAIQFEYGGANIDSRTFLRDFYELLQERGFAVGKLMRDGRVELRPYRSWMENFSYANYAALSRRFLDGRA